MDSKEFAAKYCPSAEIDENGNLTVGGSLDLRGTGITSLPDNLTVGGSLDLRGTGITEKQRSNVKKLKHGDYIPQKYLYADNILIHVKRAKKVGGYTYYIGKIPTINAITDGKGNYAHGKDLKSAMSDLQFKLAKDRGADQYRETPIDNQIPVDAAIVMYRIITGACGQGVDSFLESLDTVKSRYSPGEIIALTKGKYGNETFAKFFER